MQMIFTDIAIIFFFFLENGIDFHDIVYLGTSTSKKLSDVGEWIPASDLLIRLHGALMLASWIGTASIGMLLARYYRQTWVNSQLCGKDHWFAVSAQLFGQLSSYLMFHSISRFLNYTVVLDLFSLVKHIAIIKDQRGIKVRMPLINLLNFCFGSTKLMYSLILQ